MMRRLWFGFVTLLMPLAIGCSSISPSGGSGTSASGGLASMFQFSAYPGAKLVSEYVYTSSFAMFSVPGNHGFRTYETKDSPQVVAEYYRKLGKGNGWDVELGNTVIGPIYPYVTMKTSGYEISVTDNMGVDENDSIQPSPSPGTLPNPISSASPSPYKFRIEAQVVN